MPSSRLIRRITAWWLRRCAEKRLASIPGYRRTMTELADRRRHHKPTRDLLDRRRQLIHDEMRGAL